MDDEQTPEAPPNATKPNLEVINGGRLDPVNSSDRVTLSELMVDPNKLGTTSTKMTLTASAGKPNRGTYFRVNPDPHFSMISSGLKADDGSLYLVTDIVRDALRDEVTYYQLHTTMTRAGGLGIWHISMPGTAGRMTDWTRSALEAANMAMKDWIRIRANMSIGAYEVHRLLVTIPEPEWPDLTYEEILNLAFKDRIITSIDHPLVRQLRGLA